MEVVELCARVTNAEIAARLFLSEAKRPQRDRAAVTIADIAHLGVSPFKVVRPPGRHAKRDVSGSSLRHTERMSSRTRKF